MQWLHGNHFQLPFVSKGFWPHSAQQKLQAEQETERYDFILEKEQKEAERTGRALNTVLDLN